MARKKTFDMLLTVAVPTRLSGRDARREVKTLINDQSNWRSDLDLRDIQARTVTIVKPQALGKTTHCLEAALKALMPYARSRIEDMSETPDEQSAKAAEIYADAERLLAESEEP